MPIRITTSYVEPFHCYYCNQEDQYEYRFVLYDEKTNSVLSRIFKSELEAVEYYYNSDTLDRDYQLLRGRFHYNLKTNGEVIGTGNIIANLTKKKCKVM